MELSAVQAFLSGFDDFLIQLGAALGMFSTALVVYVLLTPHKELALIREGNPSAAVAFGGVVLAAPLLAKSIGFSPPHLAIYAGAALFAACAALLGAERSKAGAPLLATLFGLVHGAGFAGALKALSLPPDRIAPALFGFNVGVELGQLIALAAMGLVAALVARAPAPARVWTRDAIAAALLGLGVFWFAERTFLSI